MVMGFVFSHMSINCMVCHLSKRPYNPFSSKIVRLVLVASAGIFCLDQLMSGKVNMLKFIQLLFAVVVLCQWHYIINLVFELANALNIRIFFVKSEE